MTDGLDFGMLDLDSGHIVVDNDPILVKLNVPYREIIDAMDYLRQRFKTSDAFFPGYEGIVMAMNDHVDYQVVKERIGKGLRACSMRVRIRRQACGVSVSAPWLMPIAGAAGSPSAGCLSDGRFHP